MTAVVVYVALSVLLVAGKVLRVQVPVLQRLYLPSSVVGGLIGLVAVACLGKHVPAGVTVEMSAIPGFLINIIFATLLLVPPSSRAKTKGGEVFPQLTLAQIVVWGQYVVGVGLAGFLFAPAFGMHPAFGNLLELGFEGGHGTVGGMSAAFAAHGWQAGIALGYTVATCGMVGGIVVGMGIVNWAYGRRLVKSVRPFSMKTASERRGIPPRDARPPAGSQTVLPDSVDSLAWHIAVVGLAVLAGFGMLQALKASEVALFPNASTRIFAGFPMFPLCMLGGFLLRKGMGLLGVDLLVDAEQLRRISGASLDFLAVAAITTIQLDVVAANWLPLVIMVAAGLVWTAFAVLFVSPRIFRSAWFERGIAEFGQATGVTATGLLLLRTVDPDNKTSAAESFAGKQLVHEPMMNLWVAVAFALVMTVGWIPVFAVSLAMLALWSVVAFVLARRRVLAGAAAKRISIAVCAAVATLHGFAGLLPVEIYEKGGGDVDCSARYSIAELVRDTGVETADFKLCRRLVKVTNTSNETRTFQAVVRAASDFKPTNWVIPGVIYGDCNFGNQVSPSGLERDGEPWVFGYDRESIPSCTLSETKDALFAMFASDRDRASLESSCSLKRLPDGRLEHRIFYPVRESPVCYAFKFSYVGRYDEWITLPPGATFEAESYFMTGRPRWENCGYREAFKAAMAVLKHDHPIPAMDVATAEKVSHQWILDCCEKNVADGKSKGAMGTDISFRLGYTARTNKLFFPSWMTEAEKKLTLADLERDPSLNRHWLRTYWMDEMGFAGQGFMTRRFAYKGAVERGDAEFAKWVLDDLDSWVKLQKESGLVYTRRRQKKSDHLSVTELGWGLGEISKIWKMLKDGGVDHPLYLDFAKKLADFFVAHYDESDPFGRIWSLKTGEKLEGGGDGGGFMVKGMLELHEVCGDRRYLDCAKKAFDRYFEMDLAKFRCVAGADDCNCVDKESSFPYIYSALELYRQTGDRHYLDCAERVAAYFCSWMFTYDALYPATSEFGRFGYHTSGGTLVSCEHPAIDPYATVAIPDLFDLADLTGEKVWREAGRLIWVNAMQDVAGPEGGSMNGVLRTPGSQCEAHSQTRWAKYRSDPVAARGNFNNQCTAFIVTFRLYALDRVGDPMKDM